MKNVYVVLMMLLVLSLTQTINAETKQDIAVNEDLLCSVYVEAFNYGAKIQKLKTLDKFKQHNHIQLYELHKSITDDRTTMDMATCVTAYRLAAKELAQNEKNHN